MTASLECSPISPSTVEDSQRLPSGGMPDTDPLEARDPEAEAVRARVLKRLIDEDEGPTRIGRFVLLERVAEGGMGIVFAAYDPELDRKVAVKLLRRDLADESVRRRIVREAQAMAKLSHPNVAQVYEVGEHQGRTLIAMEFVRGETLRAWQKHEHPWREVLDVYLQAGRGLAAAHAAGLVHRDFKPDNAIVTPRGVHGETEGPRVRVLDFGLARASEAPPELATGTLLPAPHEPALATPLTHTGSIMGTPAYMAPEQFLGEEVTAQSDQFAFCVALWEALHGERPFAGTTRADLVANVTRGRMREVPKQSRVPTWLRAVLTRGLAVGPADRFATMDALLGALRNDPTRRRRRILLAGSVVATVALGIAGVDGAQRYRRAQQIAACEDAGNAIDEVWNADARTRAHDALIATGVGYAPTTAERVMPWLDERAEEWRAHATSACMDADVHETMDADTRARAQWCLDDRRLELAALVDELGRADAEVVRSAVHAASALAPSSSCVDVRALALLPAPPEPDARDAITKARGELAQARASILAGKYAAGLEAARRARARADEIGWPPLSAAALEAEGDLLGWLGEYSESEAVLTAAYLAAAKADDWDTAAWAATGLVYVVGSSQARYREGLAWAKHAEVAATHAGDPQGLRDAALSKHVALVLNASGASDEARSLQSHVLAIQEAVLGSEHLDVAATLGNLANVYSDTGDYAEARALNQRVLAIRTAALGPDHPDLATTLNNLANVELYTGAFAESKRLHRRALEIDEKAFGSRHADVAVDLNNLGLDAFSLGDYAEAQQLFERALSIYAVTVAADHPSVGTALTNLASVHYAFNDNAKARDVYRRALVIYEKALGADHPQVAMLLNNLGAAEFALGDYAESKALNERALAIDERTYGVDAPEVGSALMDLCKVALVQSRFGDAAALAERAVRVLEHSDLRPTLLASARFLLAQALNELPASRGRDGARAIRLAKAARETFRAVPTSAAELAEVDEWLKSYARP